MRIASLISAATEMLYAIGAGNDVVAVSHECDFPIEAAAKPRATHTTIVGDLPSAMIDRQVKELVAAGKPLYEVDVDLLAALKPDLIVTQAQCDVCAVRYDDVVAAVEGEPALRGTPIVALNPRRLADVFADIERLGNATQREQAAENFVATLKRRLAAVQETTGRLPVDRRRLTACIEWIEPMMIAGNWTPELIDLAGGRQSWAVAEQHSEYVAWDEVRAADPEVIVVMPCGFDLNRTRTEAAILPKLPGWYEVRAVRAGRVYAVDGNALFNRAGPRLIESVELLARLIHPELHARLEPIDARLAVGLT